MDSINDPRHVLPTATSNSLTPHIEQHSRHVGSGVLADSPSPSTVLGQPSAAFGIVSLGVPRDQTALVGSLETFARLFVNPVIDDAGGVLFGAAYHKGSNGTKEGSDADEVAVRTQTPNLQTRCNTN